MKFESQECGTWTEIMVELNRKEIWMFLKALLKGGVMFRFFCKPVGNGPNMAVGGVEISPLKQE